MTDNALDEKACAQTSLTDHIARFWHMIEDEPHVRILVNVRRDMSSVPYWDSSSFPNDVAKAIAAERRASPSQVSPQPQAGEPIGYLVQGFDGEPFFAPDREQYDRQGHAVVPVYASPQPANLAQVTDAMVEAACAAHWSYWPNDRSQMRLEAARRDMRASLAAAIGAGGQAVAVKPLEWEEGNPFLWYAADLYRIEDNGTNWKEDRYWLFSVGERSKHPTLEAAKAAAQADYERRILSAISQPHPADERVVEALRGLLEYVDQTICTHDSTHRSGAIWTICDDCGKQWADDEGGFEPYVDAEPVATARAALSAKEGQ